MTGEVGNAQKLRRAKRTPFTLLLIAVSIFLLSLLPMGLSEWVIRPARYISEAAMVGGLADWFAVTALFRPINIPVFSSHTGVIPRNKSRIASSIGEFVQVNFLKNEALVDIVKRNDPAKLVADWFLQPANSERFGKHSANLLYRAINELHEESVQALMSKTLRDAFKNVDLSRKTGEILELMMSGGKHHELLDQAIASLTESLRDPRARANIATAIAKSIRDEYPNGQILVPTEAVGSFAANKIAGWVESYLKNVSEQPNHEIRDAFNNKIKMLIVHLKGNSEFAAKGEEIKAYILRDEKFVSTMRSLWDELRGSVEKDLRNANSEIYKKLVATGNWIGTTLEADRDLRSSFNRQAETLVEEFGPALGAFVSGHIERTVNAWDANEMSSLIEESIGSDLQRIRTSGTCIGGALGFILFVIVDVVFPMVLR